MKKKILVLGNYKDAMYHPFGGVDERLKKMFPELELICTDKSELLTELEKEGFAGVISYLDIWDGALAEREAEALYGFVQKGGALLVLHNGISIQSRKELRELIGAKFVTHPPQEVIRFEVKSHLITEGCDGFELSEEPYRFEMEKDGKELILTYFYRGQEYPAGWCKRTGMGRTVFLTPGHTPEIFDCPSYAKLIGRSMEWCLGITDGTDT